MRRDTFPLSPPRPRIHFLTPSPRQGEGFHSVLVGNRTSACPSCWSFWFSLSTPTPSICVCLSSVCVSSCVSVSGIILGCLSTLFIEAVSQVTRILCLQLLGMGLLPVVIPTRHFCGFLGTPAPDLMLAEQAFKLPSHLSGLPTVAF